MAYGTRKNLQSDVATILSYRDDESNGIFKTVYIDYYSDGDMKAKAKIMNIGYVIMTMR